MFKSVGAKQSKTVLLIRIMTLTSGLEDDVIARAKTVIQCLENDHRKVICSIAV